MTAVSTSAVNNHTIEVVYSQVGRLQRHRFIQELAEIDFERELESTRFLVSLESSQIVGESEQRECQYRRQCPELCVLLGISILVVALLAPVLIRAAKILAKLE